MYEAIEADVQGFMFVLKNVHTLNHEKIFILFQHCAAGELYISVFISGFFLFLQIRERKREIGGTLPNAHGLSFCWRILNL